MSQMKSVSPAMSYFFKAQFKLNPNLGHCLHICLFPTYIISKILHKLSFPTMHATSIADLSSFEFIILIIIVREHKLRSSSNCFCPDYIRFHFKNIIFSVFFPNCFLPSASGRPVKLSRWIGQDVVCFICTQRRDLGDLLDQTNF
jgi:hypothetical protein